MSFPLSLPNLAHRIWVILVPAITAVGTDGMRRGSPEKMLGLAQERMSRLHARLRHLIAWAIAGTLPRVRPRRPPADPANPIERPEGWTPKPRAKSRWPRAFGWVTKLAGNGMAIAAVEGVGWLIDHDAEMKLLMDVAGPQVVRTLRALFWAVGATLPPALRKPEAMVPIPPDYKDRTRKVKGGGFTFTRHAKLVMQGWRPPTPPPRRKPRTPSAAKLAERVARQELKRIKAWVLADDEAKLKLGRGWLRRPRPKSRILGI